MGLQEPQTWMQLQGVCPSPEVLLVRTPWARPIGKSSGWSVLETQRHLVHSRYLFFI